MATMAEVPEPKNGSIIKSFSLLDPLTKRSISADGNCAGWGVLSFELLLAPDVTLGICQTSVGFFPKGLHLNLPFFF